MIISADLDQLIEPLVTRTSGNLSAHYSDLAAVQILKRLGLSLPYVPDITNSERQASQAPLWIDTKALGFLSRFPNGKGIEINCGISTRFHRLSYQSDWPRFSWLICSTPEVDDCIKYAMPESENLKTTASIKPLSAWVRELRSAAYKAVFIVIGEYEELTLDNIDELFESLSSAILDGFQYLELVVYHRGDATLQKLLQQKSELRVLDCWTQKTPWYQSLLEYVSLRRSESSRNKFTVSHLGLKTNMLVES